MHAALAVLLAAAAHLPAETLFERQLDKSVVKQYETYMKHVYPRADTSREQAVQQAQLRAKNEAVLKIELLRDPERNNRLYFRITRRGRKLSELAAEKQWRAYALKNLSCGKNFGEFTFGGSVASPRVGDMFYDEPGAIGMLTERYRGPKDGRVEVVICETSQLPISMHQFLRRVIREECALAKTDIGWVVLSRDTFDKTRERGAADHVAWLSGPRRSVSIASHGGEPEGLIPLYGKRYPSSLPKDLEIDKAAWGRDEMGFWLGRMKKALKSDNRRVAKGRLHSCFEFLGQYVYLPMLQGMTLHDATLDVLEERYRLMATWWEEHKDDTYWDKKLQKLVAKGWSPEDLAAAARKRARKRAEEQTEARLNAPLTDEKLKAITAALTQQMERQWGERAARSRKYFGEDCGAKLEKVRDGAWRLAWKQSKPGSLIIETHTGPVVTRQGGSRRYPITATFTREHYSHLARKRVSSPQVFYYDKLRDQWTRRRENESRP